MRSRRACLPRRSRGASASSPAISALYATGSKTYWTSAARVCKPRAYTDERAPPGHPWSPPRTGGAFAHSIPEPRRGSKATEGQNPPQRRRGSRSGRRWTDLFGGRQTRRPDREGRAAAPRPLRCHFGCSGVAVNSRRPPVRSTASSRVKRRSRSAPPRRFVRLGSPLSQPARRRRAARSQPRQRSRVTGRRANRGRASR